MPILNYGSDKQQWENAHVDDYAKSGGQKKDRRWAEGSTTIRTVDAQGRPLYYLTYSANNFENAFYGVGYATATNPLGPWRKSPANPVLSQDPAKGLYSTGHGGVIASPDGTELYYVHHGRPATTSSRALYTSRMRVDASGLSIEASTSDEPLPSGAAPLTVRLGDRVLRPSSGHPATTTVHVTSGTGAGFDLTNPLNRVRAELAPAGAGSVTVRGGEVTVTATGHRPAVLTVVYQRQLAGGGYRDVANTRPHVSVPVQVTVPVVPGR